MADNMIEVEARLKDYISSNLNNLEANLKKFNTTVQSSEKQVDIFDKELTSLMSRFGPLAIATAAVTAATKAMNQAFSDAKVLARMNQQLGISIELLNTLDDAVRHAGGDLSSMTMGIKGFEVAIEASNDATSKQAEAFRRLGVVLSGDVETDFKNTIMALSRIDSQSTKAAIATVLFGRAALEILPTLKELSKNIDNKTSGMSDETIAELRRVTNFWGDVWDNIGEFAGTAIAGISKVIGSETKERLEYLTKIKKAYDDAGISTELLEGKINKLRDALNYGTSYDPEGYMRTYAPPDKKAEEARRKKEEEEAEKRRQQTLDRIKKAQENAYNAQREFWEEDARIRFEAQEQEKADQIAFDNWELEQKRTADALLLQEDANYVMRHKAMQENIRQQVIATMDAYWRTNSAIMQMGRLAIQDAKMGAEKKKNILKGMAVADAAGAAVKGIYTVWSGEGETWYKIAMTAVTVAEIAAMAATQIGQINAQKFARGSRSTPGGMAIVGDAGPELLRLPMGSTIYNNSETRNMLGGNNFNINLSIPSGARVDDSAARTISDSMKQLGEMLVNADRNGYLRDFRARIAA